MRTYKFNELTKRQVDTARRFGEKYGMTVSQAAKYLDYLFALERGEISKEKFQEVTGVKVEAN